MADRRVTRSRKDRDGDITALCNHGEYWSPREKHLVISDIELGHHSYYVDASGFRTNVQVITRPDGSKYLRTTADSTSRNNLDNLPDC